MPQAPHASLPAVRLFVWQHSPASFFEEGFSKIAETRMKGLPICHPSIKVKALDFQPFGKHWIGAIVTPWSILVILACGSREDWVSLPATIVRSVELPAGEFSFMGMQDTILGEYQMCSLKSPLHDVADQASAEAIASTALELMMRPDTPLPQEEEGTPLKPGITNAQGQPAKVIPIADRAQTATPQSRRAFFTRYLSTKK